MARIDTQAVQIAESLRADLYLPEPEDKNGAAVVLVYGGGWKTGDPSQQKIYGLSLAKAGFTCLAAAYRSSAKAHWPAQLHDVQSALTWLRQHATELDLEPDRVGISGNSSGGHLALMTGCVGEPETPAYPKAICALYPPTDLTVSGGLGKDQSVTALLGPNTCEEDYKNASPLTYAARAFPPTLLISGRSDQRVPVSQTIAMNDALCEAGNLVELHLFAGLGHAFDGDREHARLCATIMIRFFAEHL